MSPVRVRLTLSKPAADKLAEPRVRRLLELELRGSATVAAGIAGPLDDDIAILWIDLPSSSGAILQVRAGERPMVTRQIALDGLAADIAARLVAIAAAQMVRSQMAPLRPRRPPPPRKPTPEELELAARTEPAVSASSSLGAVFMPGADRLLAGPALTLSLRQSGLTERLFARALGDDGGAGPARWLELGIGADHRLWLTPSMRLAVGASAALGSLHLASARAMDGEAGKHDAWSMRASGALAFEVRVSDPVWLGLGLEPGAVLRSVRYEDAHAAGGSFGGAWIGLDLSLIVDHLAVRK